MRMYTLHFGHGLEHTELLLDQAKGNLPYNFDGWNNGTQPVDNAESENSQIVSHKEIFERYGVKGGHGEYCLETWSHQTFPQFSAQLHTGGRGDLPNTGHEKDARALYLKFDFMYTNTPGGKILVLQRTATNSESRDFTLSISNGILSIRGTSAHVTQPDTGFPKLNAWIAREDGNEGSIFLEPDKWHEIQIFMQPFIAWDVSFIGKNPPIVDGYSFVETFVPAFQEFERGVEYSVLDAETPLNDPADKAHPLQMDPWPSGGHPISPNVMLPGDDQTIFPPPNPASGQYFYGEDIGLVYVWVNGSLDIQTTASMSNETDPWEFNGDDQAIHLGYTVDDSDPDDDRSGRFFYDNIIWNDIRNPSGSFPSKIFDPLYSSDPSLEWNPNYKLKFTAMEMDPDFWLFDNLGLPRSRKHDFHMPDFPKGRLVPSGEPFFVSAPNRTGAPTDRMIPHGTKLTVVHLDWDGELQGYIADTGNRILYPDYDVDYTHQHLHPNESNPFSVNQDDPRIKSQVSGNKSLFYLKRPPTVSGKQNFAGGPGLGGIKDYVPVFSEDLGDNGLPVIYRIWTCLQDHTIGSVSPIDTQHHMIRVPSGISGHLDVISDNQCPGDRTYRSYHDGNAAISNGYSMADWPYNPVSGTPWTWDELDNLQIGVSHESHAGNNTIEIYSMYLVIEHSSPVNPEISILGTNLLEWPIADEIPFFHQQKSMYHPGWKFRMPGFNRQYYNRWNIDPIFTIDRTNRQTSEGQATISGMQFSGTISFDYSIKYLTGEIVPGANYRLFDEHFPEVWVYHISGFAPGPDDNSGPIRFPHRGEVITDALGNNFTFLTYPVLQYNTQKYANSPNQSPLNRFPYIIYDYQTLYIVPLTTHRFANLIDPEEVLRTWTDSNTRPDQSGTWTIQKSQNAFNFLIDKDSYFHPFSPSSVANHVLTHPNENLNLIFPPSRSGHDYYFQAPNLATGSVNQIIYLVDKLGVPEVAIDNGLYEVHIGLWQTTINQATNDTGEGTFEFFSGDPDISTLISGHTFGPDGTAGWHLNETTVNIPSGTRQARFTFDAVRHTIGDKSPGGNLGGTSNFAAFDEPFFIMAMSSGFATNDFHPADVDENNRISSSELANYTGLWQSGSLPPGVSKDFLTQAKHIWQSGVSTHFGDASGGLYRDSSGPLPDRWLGSGLI